MIFASIIGSLSWSSVSAERRVQQCTSLAPKDLSKSMFHFPKGVLQTAVSDIWLHHDTDHHHHHHPHHDITDHLRIGGCGKSLWKGAVDGRYCRDRPGFYDFYNFILQRLFSFIIFSFSYCKNCPSFMTFFHFHIADTIILTALTFLPPAQFHHTGCFFTGPP